MTKNRIIALLLVLVMSMSIVLTGCIKPPVDDGDKNDPTPTPTPSLQAQVGLPSSQKRFLYKQPVQPKSFPDKHVFPAEN